MNRNSTSSNSSRPASVERVGRRRVLTGAAAVGLFVGVLTACGDSGKDSLPVQRRATVQPSDTAVPVPVLSKPIRISPTTGVPTTRPTATTAPTESSQTDPDQGIVNDPSIRLAASREPGGGLSILADRALMSLTQLGEFRVGGDQRNLAKSIRSTASQAALASVGSNGPQLPLPPRGKKVKVTGVVWSGQTVTVDAEKLADGRIAFIDSSQPGADRGSGKGLSVVFDGSGLESFDNLPGTIATMNEGDEPDRDVLTAAWAAKSTLDFLRTEFGRNSYDGNGGNVISVVHVPAALGGCDSWPAGSVLLFTGRCMEDDQELFPTTVDIGRFAYLLMTEVQSSTAPNLFWTSGQRGAVSIGTSDYLALVVQNRGLGSAHSVLGAGLCPGLVESYLCRPWKPDESGLHDLDTGAVFDDAQFLLREPLGNLDFTNKFRIQTENSLIWSNALFQIRKAFSSEDGGDMVTSAAAARFDKIVYRALTEYSDSEGDMMSAASALQQAAQDLNATADELSVIEEQFVISQLCAKCTTPKQVSNQMAASFRTEHRPNIVDGGVVYHREVPGPGGSRSYTEAVISSFADPNVDAPTGNSALAAGSASFDVRGTGDWIVDTRFEPTSGKWQGVFLTQMSTGKSERIDGVSGWAAPAISAETVVWPANSNGSNSIRARATKGGKVQSLSVDIKPILLAVDGKTVAYQLQDGTLGVWDLASNKQRSIATLSGMPDSVLQVFPRIPGELAVSGNRVAVLSVKENYSLPFTVQVFDLVTNEAKTLSTTAYAAGLSMKGDTVIWSEIVGDQPSAIGTLFSDKVPDTDLAGYSFKTDETAILLTERGQQGFPSIGDGKLAWQDSVSGADDIYIADLPEGW